MLLNVIYLSQTFIENDMAMLKKREERWHAKEA
jgi:hypothetical protein